MNAIFISIGLVITIIIFLVINRFIKKQNYNVLLKLRELQKDSHFRVEGVEKAGYRVIDIRTHQYLNTNKDIYHFVTDRQSASYYYDEFDARLAIEKYIAMSNPGKLL